ncbi:MAG: hypothetical protein U0989_03380 [Azonexus sp.]|nr:hypothetical protein [Azonexus sp.]
MHDIHLSEVQKLVASLHDDRQPWVVASAMALRDQWLLEYELGLVRPCAEGLTLLEAA